MTSASKTSERTRSYADVLRPTRDPSIEPPGRFERVKKQPGSLKLVCGEWVEVKEGDDDVG